MDGRCSEESLRRLGGPGFVRDFCVPLDAAAGNGCGEIRSQGLLARCLLWDPRYSTNLRNATRCNDDPNEMQTKLIPSRQHARHPAQQPSHKSRARVVCFHMYTPIQGARGKQTRVPSLSLRKSVSSDVALPKAGERFSRADWRRSQFRG